MGNRNNGLDLMKFICAFLVVCIHIRFPAPLGGYVQAIARVAVPLFLITTGYYLLGSPEGSGASSNQGYVLRCDSRRFLGLIKTILFVNAFYFVVYLVDNLASGKAEAYLHKVFSVKALTKLLVFNISPFCVHLWYLNALLYAMAFILLIEKLRCRKLLYLLTPFLIAADFVFGTYSIFILGRIFPVHYTRNWLIFALPNLCIGMMLREWNAVERLRRYRLPLIALSLLLIALTVVEYRTLYSHFEHKVRENYISTVLSCAPLFICFAQTAHIDSRLIHWFAELGHKTYSGVYYYHYFFVLYLPKIFKQLGLYAWFKPIRPIVVFTVSVIAVLIYLHIAGRLQATVGKKCSYPGRKTDDHAE